MDDDDDIVRPTGWVPLVLDTMSVAQLEDYIAQLEAEIARVRADIEAKKSHLSGAEALFKK
jgi:uncharacterized small protein (DUF1192 family)